MMIRTARLERALEHALRAPSVHNTQPWRWQLQGDVIKLFADFDRRLPANDPGGRDLLISCGQVRKPAELAALRPLPRRAGPRG